MTSSPPAVRHWLAAASDLLLGARCHGCGLAGWGVCPGCRRELETRRPRWTRPDPCPLGFPPTVASSAYDDLLRGLVNAHKERQALGLTPVLGERLARSVATVLTGRGWSAAAPVALVPVPSAARAVRERGLDATAATARAAARRLRPAYAVAVVSALAQVAGVRDQSGLDARARAVNLAGAFRLRRLTLAPVVLVDDLVTTGASLAEAAQVLRRAGVEVVGAATVAATVRWRRPSRPSR